MNEELYDYILNLIYDENNELRQDAQYLAMYCYVSDLCAEYNLNAKQREKALNFYEDTNDKAYIDRTFQVFVENDIF
jgi:hypothetical protein